MTFYEAAVQILMREGRPLHAREITEIALRENLLSHVGKQPELTMASRLAAMARRSHDRRLVSVEPDTFGLVDWNLPASPEALEASGLPEAHDETEPPLRGRERHPRISKENVRVAGRGERRRREEGERKKKRLPPMAELVYELLDRVGRPAPLFDLVASARERELLGEDIGAEAVEATLRSENERREADGKRPVFEFHEGGFVGLRGRHGAPEEGFDVLPAVAAAARDLALERQQPKPAPAPAAAPVAPAAALRGPLAQGLSEARQRAVKQLRRRLCELDGGGIEAVAALALEAMGYREVRAVKRGKEGALFVAKRRMGLVELRHCVRAIRAGRDLRKEDILDLRRELVAHGAQLGVLLSPADASRDARAEATVPGAAVVLLLCADALADQLVEKGLGVTTRTVTVVEFDENAFKGLRREERPAEERREGEGKPKDEGRREREERREERRRAREERREARAAARAAAQHAGEVVVPEGTVVAPPAAEGTLVEPTPVEGQVVEEAPGVPVIPLEEAIPPIAAAAVPAPIPEAIAGAEAVPAPAPVAPPEAEAAPETGGAPETRATPETKATPEAEAAPVARPVPPAEAKAPEAPPAETASAKPVPPPEAAPAEVAPVSGVAPAKPVAEPAPAAAPGAPEDDREPRE
jgi:hypothetical protein